MQLKGCGGITTEAEVMRVQGLVQETVLPVDGSTRGALSRIELESRAVDSQLSSGDPGAFLSPAVKAEEFQAATKDNQHPLL